MVPMTWFGAGWSSWLNYECEHQDTPIGEPCFWCDEAIEPWASGVVMSCFTAHLECFLRQGMGSVGHQLGLCSCSGGPGILDDPPGLTIREAARAAVYTANGSGWQWVPESKSS